MAGRYFQALTSDNVILDFSGLFSEKPTEKQPSTTPTEPQKQQGECKSTTAEETRLDRQIEGLEAYKTYQENYKIITLLQTDILKGVQAGTDIYTLFLKAVQAIGYMTNNSLVYTQIEGHIKNIYGRGLQEKAPLALELEETQKRLQRLREAEQREIDERSRESIRRAIKAHEESIEQLKILASR